MRCVLCGWNTNDVLIDFPLHRLSITRSIFPFETKICLEDDHQQRDDPHLHQFPTLAGWGGGHHKPGAQGGILLSYRRIFVDREEA